MQSDQMLEAFKALIRDEKTPILVNFQRSNSELGEPQAPFVEVIQPDYHGKLRKFELDYSVSKKIIEHFHLPEAETAVIFENGTTDKDLHGFKNVRNYLRVLSQKN